LVAPTLPAIRLPLTLAGTVTVEVIVAPSPGLLPAAFLPAPL